MWSWLVSKLFFYEHCWSEQLNRDGAMLVNWITDACKPEKISKMFKVVYIFSLCEVVYWKLLPMGIAIAIQAYGTSSLKLHRAADTETLGLYEFSPQLTCYCVKQHVCLNPLQQNQLHLATDWFHKCVAVRICFSSPAWHHYLIRKWTTVSFIAHPGLL